MTYEKQTWECGETITAEKLNHIEDGIADASSGGGTLVIRETRTESEGDTVYTLDKTWQEIYDAYPLVRFTSSIGALYGGAIYAIKQIFVSHDEWVIRVDNGTSQTDYTTDSPSGYPSYGGGDK